MVRSLYKKHHLTVIVKKNEVLDLADFPLGPPIS
jgi:hypothetical protein